jgi:hypothetical protein
VASARRASSAPDTIVTPSSSTAWKTMMLVRGGLPSSSTRHAQRRPALLAARIGVFLWRER